MTTLTPAAPILEAKVANDAWKDGDKPRFDTTHRCDKCGAQAYVEATITTGTLLFCFHDSTAARPQMEAQGILKGWYSESGRLIENRTQGSEN
jgi:hypothetical protein